MLCVNFLFRCIKKEISEKHGAIWCNLQWQQWGAGNRFEVLFTPNHLPLLSSLLQTQTTLTHLPLTWARSKLPLLYFTLQLRKLPEFWFNLRGSCESRSSFVCTVPLNKTRSSNLWVWKKTVQAAQYDSVLYSKSATAERGFRWPSRSVLPCWETTSYSCPELELVSLFLVWAPSCKEEV